jgi:hypothetical protein
VTVPPRATHRQSRQYKRRLALRTVYVGARMHVCTYSVPPYSLEALGSALLGRLEPSGALPAPLGDLR